MQSRFQASNEILPVLLHVEPTSSIYKAESLEDGIDVLLASKYKASKFYGLEAAGFPAGWQKEVNAIPFDSAECAQFLTDCLTWNDEAERGLVSGLMKQLQSVPGVKR